MNRYRIARLLSIASRIVIAGVADDLSKKYISHFQKATPEFIKELLEYIRKEYGQETKEVSFSDQNYTVEIRKSDVDKIAKVAVEMLLKESIDGSNGFLKDLSKDLLRRELDYICNLMSILLNLKHRYPQYWDEDLKNWLSKDILSFKSYQDFWHHFEIHKGLILPDDRGRPSLPPQDKGEGEDYRYIKNLPTEAKVNGYTIKRLDNIDQLPKQKWSDLECEKHARYCITVSKSYFNSYGKPPFFWVFKENGDKFTQKGMIIPSALQTDPDQALRNEDNTDMMSGDLIQELAPFLSKYNVSFENGGLIIDDVWEKGTWSGGEWDGRVWMNGVWKDGVWKGGTWGDGDWYKGTWKNGAWKNGIWHNGTWENGVWSYGVWIVGVWKGGTWEGGDWDSGTWEDGKWVDGTWKSGKWKNGTWKDGIWKNGVFESGTWEDGAWVDGYWNNGTWKKGAWKNGAWHGGEWLGGTWKRGKIWDEELNEYVESTVSPKEYFANKKTKAASIQ